MATVFTNVSGLFKQANAPCYTGREIDQEWVDEKQTKEVQGAELAANFICRIYWRNKSDPWRPILKSYKV